MNWNLSNENLLELIDKLRDAASGELDYGELWERCEQAAEILQEMMQYEAGHGLRSVIESENEE